MIVVLLVWTFAITCLFGMGWAIAGLLPSEGRALQDAGPFQLCILGLAAITALSNCWNYFAPVCRSLDLIVLAFSLATLWVGRHPVKAYMRHWGGKLWAAGWPTWCFLGAVALVALVKSAMPSELPDEGGYYLPYIRWIEHYRIIPGLANIEERFGFNSSFHAASAFFGLSWAVPGGAYDLNGLLLLLFAGWCLGAVRRVLMSGVPRMSDIMKLFCLFFLMRNMITSSAADLSNMLLGEMVLVLFMQKIEEKSMERADVGFWLIAVASLLVVTVKLSSMFLCLVPAYATCRIWLARGKLPWVAFGAAFALIILPWLGRSPILSGYLVYPLYQVDLFHVDWKVPRAVAQREYYYVGEFAKSNATLEESGKLAVQRGLRDWLPAWFHRENMFNRSMAIAMLLSLLGLVCCGLVRFRWLALRRTDLLAFGIVLVLNVVLWFLRNPAFRFGWAWGIILVAFAFTLALRAMNSIKLLRFVTLAALMAFTAQNVVKTVHEARGDLVSLAIFPAPPPIPEVAVGHVGGLDVEVASTGPCWGILPPCLPNSVPVGLEARGIQVENGFRTVKQ